MPPVADSLSWTTFGLAVGGAGLAALLLVTLVVLVVRRRPSPTSLELVLTESSSRVETMLSELTTALDDAQAQTERSRQLAEIGSTIDLDEVVARTLEASGTLLGVEAAMLILDAPQRERARIRGDRRPPARGGRSRLGAADAGLEADAGRARRPTSYTDVEIESRRERVRATSAWSGRRPDPR